MRASYTFEGKPDLSWIDKMFDKGARSGKGNSCVGLINGHPAYVIIKTGNGEVEITYGVTGRIESHIAGYINQMLKRLGGRPVQEQIIGTPGTMDRERYGIAAAGAEREMRQTFERWEQLGKDILEGRAEDPVSEFEIPPEEKAALTAESDAIFERRKY